jgi:hypothetical protein
LIQGILESGASIEPERAQQVQPVVDQHFVHLSLAWLDSITLFTNRALHSPSHEFGK